jgi:hypothetical protein
LTVQGSASMTALKVDGSGVTQPVSGTVTANLGTVAGLALDATLTGGTQKAIARGGAKGATTASDVTSTAEGTDHQALDVQLYHGGVAVNPTAIRTLTSADVVTSAQGTAASLSGYWPVRVTDGTNTMPTGDAAARAIFHKITDGTTTAAVKAASTAAVATDPALVVAISPNNTVPVSAASLPLPAGAATAAKQPALGTAGTPSADVLTVQGAASMTALKVDGSAVTQPVSGTVTANLGTVAGLALDATLTGGTQKAVARGGAKGATTASDVTSTAEGSDHQALDVQIYHGGSAVNPTAIRALTATDVVTSAQGTAAALSGYWPVRVTDGTNTMPTGDAAGRALFHKITDGINTAAVKAASTAAVAADPALVVAISPNNTVPVSAASLPLPAGASTAAKQPALGTAGTASTDVLTVQGIASMTALKVDGSGVTQPVSASSLPLPTGAATAAKQPALGTAGTPSADVITVQGSAAMTALKVDGSGVTQPVSGTVTANVGTTNGLALDATLTGGTQKAIARGGAKGATTAADVTSTAEGADHQALDVQIYHGGSAVNPTAIRALTSADVVTSAQGTAASLSGYWPVRVTDGTNTMPTGDAAGRALFQKITDGTNTAAVKAASTAAVATDPALVVAISPNNTVPVSAASLPLPTGAATAAKQPALGTAGTPSADVITVQGSASMTALKVDGSGVTQPVSGTVTSNIGTTNGLALDATLTGGTQKAIARGGAKGATTAADVTSTAEGSDHQALDVQLYHGGVAVNPTAIRTLTSADVVTSNQGTAAALSGYWPVRVTDGTNTMPTGDSVGRALFQKITDGTNTAAVKAASTAAVATDPALVVTVSPNSPLPAGSNILGAVTQSGTWTEFVAGQVQTSSFPDPSSVQNGNSFLYLDGFNNLQTRAAVLTDEGSLREDFPGTSLSTSIGTATFTNGSAAVTGTGFLTSALLTTDYYIKRDADGSTAWGRVLSVNSDTSLTLENPYSGTTGTTASSATRWPATVVSTGTATVSGGNLVLATGATSGASAYVLRQGDYLPCYLQCALVVSQRVANQSLGFGFVDSYPTITQSAYVLFDGTTNTTVKLVTQSGAGGTETETLVCTLPNGSNTATAHIYQIDVEPNLVTLSIDGIVVGQNKAHLPGPYASLQQTVFVSNTGAASNTTLSADYIFFSNIDRVETTDSFSGSPHKVLLTDSTGLSAVAADHAAITAGSQPGVMMLGASSGVARLARVNRLGMMVPGYQTLLAVDSVEGSTINSWLWAQSTTTMTIAQTTGVLTLNNSATTTTATFAIITSTRQFPLLSQAPVACSFRASVTQTTNATQELGFGAPTGATATVNNGAFFRINTSGQIRVVTSYNGTETVSGVLATLTSTTYYLFAVYMEDNGARFVVESSSGVPLVDTFQSLPLTTPDKASVSHIPAFARVYTTGTAGVAPITRISSFQSWMYDINAHKPWAEQLSSSGRSSNVSPTAFTQTLQLAAGAAPATITPNNTGSSAYTTLGGEFVLNGTATSENLLGVFAFTVPSPYTFVLTDLIMPPPVVTTALGATVNIQEWCLMVASSTNPSTAVGQRYPLGLFSAAASAAVGTVYNGQTINARYQTPITVLPGQVLLVLVKLISGSAAGVYRGSIFLNGYYE